MHKIDHFNKEINGWSIESRGSSTYGIKWADDGGVHGGYLSYFVNDDGGGYTYLTSSPRWAGDDSAFYGGKITFDMKYAAGEDDGSEISVFMSGGGLRLIGSTNEFPSQRWASMSVNLDLSGGWFNLSTGEVATKADIKTVLGAFEYFQIDARFQEDSYETGGVDNFGMRKASPAEAMFAEVEQESAGITRDHASAFLDLSHHVLLV